MTLSLYGMLKAHGAFPNEGGVMDQSAQFLAAARFLERIFGESSAQAAEETFRAVRQKAKEAGRG